MLSLAEQQIFERYKHPERAGSLEVADLTSSGSNQSCGDEVTIFLQTRGEIITDARHQTRGCAICTASADLLCEQLIGLQLLDLPSEDQVVEWLAIPLSPIRRKCATLPLETLKKGLS